MDAVLEDWETAPTSRRLNAGLRLVEASTLHPEDITRSFVNDLIADGLDVESIAEAAAVAFQYNFINRIADAFDFDTPDGKILRKQAKLLNLMGRLGHSKPPTPSWSVGKDGLLRPRELNLTREHFLSVDGSTEPSLRRAVEAHAARVRGGKRPEEAIPEAITEYVNRLSLYAYRITDELFDGLRDAGYSDEAIYEITVAGAFGASFASIEPLFEALYGAAHQRPRPLPSKGGHSNL